MNACRSSHYSSPPPERELCMDGEHRSRRDMSPQGRKRALIRDQPASISGYQTYRKVSRCCHVISIPRFFPTRSRFPSPFREFNDRSRNGFEGMERLAGFRESSKEATPRNLTLSEIILFSYFLRRVASFRVAASYPRWTRLSIRSPPLRTKYRGYGDG